MVDPAILDVEWFLLALNIDPAISVHSACRVRSLEMVSDCPLRHITVGRLPEITVGGVNVSQELVLGALVAISQSRVYIVRNRWPEIFFSHPVVHMSFTRISPHVE